MLSDLFGIHLSFSALLLRIVLGIIFIVHGYPKLFKKDFGPRGFSGFLKNIGVPSPLLFAYVVAIVEFFGGALLIIGLFTRLSAIAIAINMFVAIWKVKGKTGLVTKVMEGGWAGGYELDLALMIMAIVLIIMGAGIFSIDHIICNQQ